MKETDDVIVTAPAPEADTLNRVGVALNAASISTISGAATSTPFAQYTSDGGVLRWTQRR
ncbi:hypothetical protein Rcae01_04489 [Novipirellula caenicola]|uniref:Uncharacterized protein n=1 Tax=Novipirellula caenicola TaxID=1536901 RepID=A0ABP9VWR3_9BACT